MKCVRSPMLPSIRRDDVLLHRYFDWNVCITKKANSVNSQTTKIQSLCVCARFWNVNSNLRFQLKCSCDIYPVPRSDLPFLSNRNVTGRSPSRIWHDIAARIPSFSILVIDCIGIIFGGTLEWTKERQMEREKEKARFGLSKYNYTQLVCELSNDLQSY